MTLTLNSLSIRYCAQGVAAPINYYRQAVACPRVAQKSAEVPASLSGSTGAIGRHTQDPKSLMYPRVPLARARSCGRDGTRLPRLPKHRQGNDS
jgi:hypothetical protein